VRRLAVVVCLLACSLGAWFWYYKTGRVQTVQIAEPQPDEDAWLDQLYSSNPAEVDAATHQVGELGARALPLIHGTFQDPAAPPQRVKAALKACGILGPVAAPAIGEVAEQLPDPTLTAEAALALSFMGRGAFGPLRDALGSEDPVVRRESLRSVGKLKERAPLDARAVVPLLVGRATDNDAGVRAVAATYLGIIHEGGDEAVQALVLSLKDPEIDVRRAAATALGSFGDEAEVALPALRKAAADADPDVAREAGVALVKLQPRK
jgi:HEAT repeat protein